MVLSIKPEVRQSFERSGFRQKDNIKMDLKGIGWKGWGLDSYGLGQGPLVRSCKHSDHCEIWSFRAFTKGTNRPIHLYLSPAFRIFLGPLNLWSRRHHILKNTGKH